MGLRCSEWKSGRTGGVVEWPGFNGLRGKNLLLFSVLRTDGELRIEQESQ